MIRWFVTPQGKMFSLSNLYIPPWNWTTFSFPRGHYLESMRVPCNLLGKVVNFRSA